MALRLRVFSLKPFSYRRMVTVREETVLPAKVLSATRRAVTVYEPSGITPVPPTVAL
jgi:hypothetical protein